MKFEVRITNVTDSIQAMVFTEVAQEYYAIIGADIDTPTMNGSFPIPLLQKLSQPKDYNIHLKAHLID